MKFEEYTFSFKEGTEMIYTFSVVIVKRKGA